MWFKFWVRSSRGTDTSKFVDINDAGMTKAQVDEHVKDVLDEWVDDNYSHLEFFRYGWLKKKPPAAVKDEMIEDAKRAVKAARARLRSLQEDA